MNCDGTKSTPRITPGDAQAIFDKYLARSELPDDCSGNSRAAALSIKKFGSTSISLIINDVAVKSGEEIVVPVIIDSSSDISMNWSPKTGQSNKVHFDLP